MTQNKDNKFKFAELLTRYMQRTGISNATLAHKVGVRRETIWHWKEEGRRPSSKNYDAVRKCAEILRLTPDERKAFLEAVGCPDSESQNDNVNLKSDENERPLERPLVPATTTRPISDPKQFFGREAILERLFNAWGHIPLEHAVITGPESSGKTSLLNYVKTIHDCRESMLREGQRYDWLKQKYLWIFVDFENVQLHRPENFLRYVLKELKSPCNSSNDWIDLAEILNDSVTIPTVILMDNIESGLKSPELDERFWEYIRHLGNHIYELGFCVASRRPLNELEEWAEQLGKASPTANIFGEIELGPLTEAEARDLLSYASLSEADTEWILEKSQGWPLLLQMLCQIRGDSEEGEEWKKVALAKIERYDSEQ